MRILILLFHQEYCVCQICGILGESQPKVSKHLAKLRDLGLVKDVRKEQFMYYSITLEPLFYEIIQKIVASADLYPVIRDDIQKREEAQSYLESCSTITPKS